MGQWAKDVTELVGHTPLVELKRITSGVGATVLAKLEMFSPGGSVKDRIALRMICEAEAQGLLRPGGIITEPTSGNMGISFAWLAAARGYQCILTMPDTISLERRLLLRRFGAQVILTPGSQGMRGAINKVIELRTTLPNSCTGGTLTGVAEGLRARNPSLEVIAVEPASSAVLSGGRPGPHRIEGLGAGFQPDTLRIDLIDAVVPVTDEDAVATAIRLMELEGLSVGISSGAVAWAALQEAGKEHNRGKVIVTIFPSAAERYLHTVLFEDLRE